MPTLSQIEAASDTLTDTAQAQALALIRSSAIYKRSPNSYLNLADTIAAATETQAKQINASLTNLDSSGNVEGAVRLSGSDQDGVVFSQVEEREVIVDYILHVLYDSPPRNVILSSTVTVAQEF